MGIQPSLVFSAIILTRDQTEPTVLQVKLNMAVATKIMKYYFFKLNH